MLNIHLPLHFHAMHHTSARHAAHDRGIIRRARSVIMHQARRDLALTHAGGMSLRARTYQHGQRRDKV